MDSAKAKDCGCPDIHTSPVRPKVQMVPDDVCICIVSLTNLYNCVLLIQLTINEVLQKLKVLPFFGILYVGSNHVDNHTGSYYINMDILDTQYIFLYSFGISKTSSWMQKLFLSNLYSLFSLYFTRHLQPTYSIGVHITVRLGGFVSSEDDV